MVRGSASGAYAVTRRRRGGPRLIGLGRSLGQAWSGMHAGSFGWTLARAFQGALSEGESQGLVGEWRRREGLFQE